MEIEGKFRHDSKEGRSILEARQNVFSSDNNTCKQTSTKIEEEEEEEAKKGIQKQKKGKDRQSFWGD